MDQFIGSRSLSVKSSVQLSTYSVASCIEDLANNRFSPPRYDPRTGQITREYLGFEQVLDEDWAFKCAEKAGRAVDISMDSTEKVAKKCLNKSIDGAAGSLNSCIRLFK